MRRKARKPARMLKEAEASGGMSTAESVIAAASKIAPEAVIHELSERGERKKTRAGNVYSARAQIALFAE